MLKLLKKKMKSMKNRGLMFKRIRKPNREEMMI